MDVPESHEFQTRRELPVSIEHPPGAVPVYIRIDKTDEARIAEQGFVIDSRTPSARPEKEQVWEEERERQEIPVSRQRCIFAYPRTPNRIGDSLSFRDDRHVLVEAWIDPTPETRVAPAEVWTESDWAGRHLTPDEERAVWQEAAQDYWRESKPFQEYIDEGHIGKYSPGDFGFPEVLIPANIPPGRIRKMPEYSHYDEDEE